MSVYNLTTLKESPLNINNEVKYRIERYYVKDGEKIERVEFSNYLNYEQLVYFDIETIDPDTDFEGLTDRERLQFLNMSNLIIKQYSVLIPKKHNNISKIYSYLYRDKNGYFEEKEEYITFTFFSSESAVVAIHLLDFIENCNIKKLAGFNSSKFDALIFRNLGYELREDNRQNCIIAQKIKSKINKKNEIVEKIEQIKIYDLIETTKFFRLNKLSDVGEFVNIKKEDINIASKNREDFIKYNIIDVTILYEFVKKLNLEFNIRQNNISSYVRKYYIKRLFEKENAELISTSIYINNFHLFAARTEPYVYKLVDKKVYYLDYNSLYTSARVELKTAGYKKSGKNLGFTMQKVRDKYKLDALKFRIYLLDFTKHDYKSLASQYHEYFTYFYLAKVKINGIRDEYKDIAAYLNFYFPFVYKNEERSCFAFNREIEYQVGFYELMFLHFFDFDFIEIYEIPMSDDPFKDELIKMYSMRKEAKKRGDKNLDLFYKLFLNIGYGIWATRNRTKVRVTDRNMNSKIEELKDRYTFFKLDNTIGTVSKYGDSYFIEKIGDNKKWTDNSIPVLAFSIVSNARFMMYSIFLYCVFNKEIGIYYTDTDSIFCNQRVYDYLKEQNLIGKELGQLKDEIEDGEIVEAYFLAPKTYYYKVKKDDIESLVIRLKGTGENWERDIVRQSVKSEFKIINKVAIDPEEDQKRILIDNLFINQIGNSEDFRAACAEFEKGIRGEAP